jgi:hypothetical protein
MKLSLYRLRSREVAASFFRRIEEKLLFRLGFFSRFSDGKGIF